MVDIQSDSSRLSRRTFLKVGFVGVGALICARWIYTFTSTPSIVDARFSALDDNGRAIVGAIAPVLLAGALPSGANAAAARDEVVAGVDKAVSGLPPQLRKEIEQLFSLLSFAPTRSLIAGIWSPWPQATEASIAGFLSSWRDSQFALLRSGYGALHQLVMASWYGNPRSWSATGYPGPPLLTR
jgi:hypothetical protein